MMQNLQIDLIELLKSDARFVNKDGKLLKATIVANALQLDAPLLKLLLSHPLFKKTFFTDIEGILIFDKVKFQTFVTSKQFLPDSYTSFKNKIGLMEGDDYLTTKGDVVLAWGYKDCVLEGGQTKDDAKSSEIFWNETLAPEQVDKLVAPKVLTGFKRHDKDGVHDIEELKDDDNFIIKGNNLQALHTLYQKFGGKIDCIYIDPPYNTKTDANTFCYNNSFNRSSWLTFMKNRLEIARSLLSKNGVLIIAIDKNEQPFLGVLLYEEFKDYDIHCITIVHNPRGAQGENFSYTNEFAYFVLPTKSKILSYKKIDKSDIDFSNFRNWGSESTRSDAKNCFYPVIVDTSMNIVGFGEVTPSEIHPNRIEKKGEFFYVFPIDNSNIERKWRYARQSVDDIRHLLNVKKSKNSEFIDIEIGKDFETYKTVWNDTRYDANEYGTKIVKSLVPDCKFSFPKSLYTVQDCIASVVDNKKSAIILDFFGGSGTTAHAVLELNRQDDGNRRFIITEQMDYISTVTVPRVSKVIENIQHNSFVYCELLKDDNQIFIDKIQASNDEASLKASFDEMKTQAFLKIEVELDKIDFNDVDFKTLSLDEKKRMLIETLDKNALYVNLSDIDDEELKIDTQTKKLNSFFKRGL